MKLLKRVAGLFLIASLLGACSGNTQNTSRASAQATNQSQTSQDFQLLELNQPMAAQIYSLGCGIGCPIYNLVINSDFSATYKGYAFVKDKSEHQFLMAPQYRSEWFEILGKIKQNTKQYSNVATCQNYRTDALRYRIVVKQQDLTFEKIIDRGCEQALATQFANYTNNLLGRWISRRSQSKIK